MDEFLFSVFVVAAGIGIVSAGVTILRNNRKNKVNMDKSEQPTSNQFAATDPSGTNVPQNELRTRELVLRTLRSIGCNPLIDEEYEGKIKFQYQGGSFILFTYNNGVLVELLFPYLYRSSLVDLDAVSVIQKAVNKVNGFDSGGTLFYYIDSEQNIIDVHARYEMCFSPEISTLDDYLRAVLRGMFETRDRVILEIRSETGDAVE